jgi:hypothetical protein
MDIVTDPTFWGETGLTVASRLAVLAAMLWIARLAVRYAPSRPSSPRRTATPAPSVKTTAEITPSPAQAPARFIDLRRSSETPKPERVPERPPAPAGHPLRNRLMAYLEHETTERRQR